MTNLEEKYRSGKISVEELRRLRKEAEGISDETLSSEMEDHWMNDAIDETNVPQERVDHVFRKVQGNIRERRYGSAWRWVAVAAAIVLPVCLFFSISTFNTVRQQAEQVLSIVTAKGEQSTISLPDGTTVKLNELSELKYSPGSFGEKRRWVSFNGEGFFNVAKNEASPFVIGADKIEVTVLGTTFNLIARSSDPFNKILLIEGSVRLVSSITGETVTLKPLEEATLDKQTGKMVVSTVSESEPVTSWVRKELTLKKVSLRELLDLLQEEYGVTFVCDKGIDTAELFTGTLPTEDLLACSEILEYAFGVKIKILDTEVRITK